MNKYDLTFKYKQTLDNTPKEKLIDVLNQMREYETELCAKGYSDPYHLAKISHYAKSLYTDFDMQMMLMDWENKHVKDEYKYFADAAFNKECGLIPWVVTDFEYKDIIQFGTYYTESNEYKSPIDFMVIARNENHLLLLSNDILMNRSFHDNFEMTIWRHSHLRKYLNTEFYNEVFSEEEKKMIICTHHKNLSNKKYDKYQNSATDDNVFILSSDEIKKYLPTHEDRKAKIIEAKKNYVFPLSYWLRDNAEVGLQTQIVTSSGIVDKQGVYGGFKQGVRVAIVVEVNEHFKCGK